jgi:site-specific recombinase XerD
VSSQALLTLAQVVSDAVQSAETKRAYERALLSQSDNSAPGFLVWYQAHGEPGLSKAVVQRYLAHLRDDWQMSAAAINQRRAAINRLIHEAVDNNAMPEQQANGILRIKGERHEGMRLGKWLSREQAQQLINAPDIATLKGLRDRAILALAIGTGLRRSELAALTFEQVQQRDGRWVLVDITGKRNKVRSVPAPSWAKQALDEYSQAAGLSEGAVFVSINKSDAIAGESLTAQAIYDVIKHYSYRLWGAAGLLAAHDARRTYAQLARKGGADIEQISLTLGHASVLTTERYLGTKLDLTSAPCDKLGLRLGE